MHCQQCGARCAPDDIYCSRCGVPLSRSGPLVPFGARGLPVPWKQVRSGVVRGAVVLAAGTAIELLRREVMRRATPANLADMVTRLWQARPQRRKIEATSVPVHVQPSPVPDEGLAEVRAFFFRRVVVRR